MPDAVADMRLYQADSSRTQFVRGVQYLAHAAFGWNDIIRKDSSFWEFKAYAAGKVIGLSDSAYQIKGLVDAASFTEATRLGKGSDPAPSTIHFVTTKGVSVGSDVLSYATSKDVLIVQHIAEEVFDTETGTSQLRVGAGVALNPAVIRMGASYSASASDERDWLPGPSGQGPSSPPPPPSPTLDQASGGSSTSDAH